jgi:hypothetical protein
MQPFDGIPLSPRRRIGGMPLLLFLLAAVGAVAALVVGPLYLERLRRELTRTEELHAIADRLGLRFIAGDPAFPASTAQRHPFELFSRGVDQTCENFLVGTLGGFEVLAFDFLYRQRVDSDGAPENDVHSEPIRTSCAIVTIAGDRAHVVIEPAGSALTARADGEPVRLEWGDFNTRYRVVSADRAFVTALLDLGLMAWLVDEAPRLAVTWELQRDEVLCRARGLAPRDVELVIRALPEFARRVGRGAAGT